MRGLRRTVFHAGNHRAEAAGDHQVSGRITSILNGKRAITPETALRLSRYFGNSAQFWMNLQTRYDLREAERKLGKRIEAEVGRVA
ncbi:MAG TPA: HigA family addiction module antitoxin [Hyphomicrobiaceae bacterium]